MRMIRRERGRNIQSAMIKMRLKGKEKQWRKKKWNNCGYEEKNG